MTEPRWQLLVDNFIEGSGISLDDINLSRFRLHEDYLLAHHQWFAGASDRVVKQLLRRAALACRG